MWVYNFSKSGNILVIISSNSVSLSPYFLGIPVIHVLGYLKLHLSSLIIFFLFLVYVLFRMVFIVLSSSLHSFLLH